MSIPAFPSKQGGYDGMTLRDYFAGQALVGFMSDSDYSAPPPKTAIWCYIIADAMIEARGHNNA